VHLLIVAGFLGSGKTTLILGAARRFADRGRSVAIIENEVGAVGVDGQALAAEGLEVREIHAGCVCCTLRADLLATLYALEREISPDLVILETDENPKEVGDQLTALGIPWLALEVRTVADCAKAWVQLGQLLGREAEAKARAAALKALVKGRSRKAGPRALTLIWRDPWMAAGPDTYVADLARQAGFRPIGPDRYPVLSEVELEALAPEAILLPTEPYRFNARHAAELRKRFPEAQVHLVDGQAMTWYLSRTEEGLERLRALAAETHP